MGLALVDGNNKQLNVLGGLLESCKAIFIMIKILLLVFIEIIVVILGMMIMVFNDYKITEDFLIYSKSVGNDLSTPIPEYNFFGLSEGVSWCLCAARWEEAYKAGKAPKVFLKSTNIATLSLVELDHLKEYAI